jgi:DNA invertase Pin-like site-specific DNA recombinase
MVVRIGYARTSTAQEEQDKSIEGQVVELKRAGCERVIAERRSAFKGNARPGWDELWALVGRGGVDEILVADQSRLSRSGDDMAFLELCAARGTKVVALVGGTIETESIGGFVQAGMMSVFSQMQSRLTAAKVRDGLRRRKAQGYYACGKVPFGYSYDGQYVVPCPDHWDAARQMWDELMELDFNVSGWIAKTQSKWTPRGVKNWIANPMLRGIVRGEHGGTKPLISWQEWAEAENKLKARSSMRGRAAHTVHLFTGLVRCESCGKSLHNIRDRAVPRLKCHNRICARYGQGIRVEVVRRKVIDALTTKAAELASAAISEKKEPAEAGPIRNQISALQAAQAAGVDGLEDKLAALHRQLQALQQVDSSARYELLVELFADRRTLELATDEELRAVILQFVSELVWPGGLESLEITLR